VIGVSLNIHVECVDGAEASMRSVPESKHEQSSFVVVSQRCLHQAQQQQTDTHFETAVLCCTFKLHV